MGLFEADPLRSEDYRQMFRVLEDVTDAPDLDTFRKRLQEAFARRLGWWGTIVLAGPTPELTAMGRPGTDYFGRSYSAEYMERWWAVDPLASPRSEAVLRTRGVVVLRELLADGSDAEREFADGFLRRYGIGDIVGAVSGPGPAGIGYFGVPVMTERPHGFRERVMVHKLRRQLSGYFDQHLAQARRTGIPGRLTPREVEVGDLVAQGYTNERTALRLRVGVDTVKKHVSRILAKTGCSSRTQYVASRLAGR